MQFGPGDEKSSSKRRRCSLEFKHKYQSSRVSIIIRRYIDHMIGPGSSVGIRTDYGLDGPG